MKLHFPPIHFKNLTFDFSRTYIMGVLNVTPDSFSDGGIFFDAAKAVEHGLKLADDGADIIDIGGESTRPGAKGVDAEEELKRVIPVIKELHRQIKIPISIDTRKSIVVEEGLNAGAEIVNDTSGFQFDPEMPRILGKYNPVAICMHIRGTPENMQENISYRSIFTEIVQYIWKGISMALDDGLSFEKIFIDPGLGFGKTSEQNLKILKNLKYFKIINRPIVVGPSRKSFIGYVLGKKKPEERLFGTIGAVSVAVLNGANIVRVHDVKEVKDVVKICDTIMNSDNI